MVYCERRSIHHRSNLATHIMERMECPFCGHREVLLVCDECVKWTEQVTKAQSSITCMKCHRTKPKVPFPIRILGKA